MIFCCCSLRMVSSRHFGPPYRPRIIELTKNEALRFVEKTAVIGPWGRCYISDAKVLVVVEVLISKPACDRIREPETYCLQCLGESTGVGSLEARRQAQKH